LLGGQVFANIPASMVVGRESAVAVIWIPWGGPFHPKVPIQSEEAVTSQSREYCSAGSESALAIFLQVTLSSTDYVSECYSQK
jgi:hypothetical protein